MADDSGSGFFATFFDQLCEHTIQHVLERILQPIFDLIGRILRLPGDVFILLARLIWRCFDIATELRLIMWISLLFWLFIAYLTFRDSILWFLAALGAQEIGL